MRRTLGLYMFRTFTAVSVKTQLGGFTVCLDGRVLRTPGGRELTLPNVALALAVASEWELQDKAVRQLVMPLVRSTQNRLCSTALDLPQLQLRDTLTGRIIEFLQHDSIRDVLLT